MVGIIGIIGVVLSSSGRVIDGSLGIVGIVGFNGYITGIVILPKVVLVEGIVIFVLKVGALTSTTT